MYSLNIHQTFGEKWNCPWPGFPAKIASLLFFAACNYYLKACSQRSRTIFHSWVINMFLDCPLDSLLDCTYRFELSYFRIQCSIQSHHIKNGAPIVLHFKKSVNAFVFCHSWYGTRVANAINLLQACIYKSVETCLFLISHVATSNANFNVFMLVFTLLLIITTFNLTILGS